MAQQYHRLLYYLAATSNWLLTLLLSFDPVARPRFEIERHATQTIWLDSHGRPGAGLHIQDWSVGQVGRRG